MNEPKLFPFDDAKSDTANVDLVPKRDRGNEIGLNLFVRQSYITEPAARSVDRFTVAGRREQHFERLREIQDHFCNELTDGSTGPR